MTKVYFNEPILQTIKAPAPETVRKEDSHQYVTSLKEAGFAVGSVVMKRTHKLFLTSPEYWGIITRTFWWKMLESWRPLEVKWTNGITEECWDCDLYLIHPCVERELLVRLLDQQDA